MAEKRVGVGIFVIIAALILASVIAGAAIRLSSISFYQGIHPQFVAVYYDDQYYTTTEPHDATTSRIGPATLNFDPDHEIGFKPNLMGELKDIQVINNLESYIPRDALTHIIYDLGGDPQPDQPYKTYEWEVEKGDGSKKVYQMDLWLCSLQVNAWARADGSPIYFISGERVNKRYSDTEIWLRLETTNEWGNYFKDPDIENTYFGLAYMELAELTVTSNDQAFSVLPRNQWAALDLYDEIAGLPESPILPTIKAESIEGGDINPTYFKNNYFTKLTLGNFGTYGYNPLDGSWAGSACQWRILVHVFVVGEWTVKPEIERDVEPPEPPGQTGPIEAILKEIRALFTWIRDFFRGLGDPVGRIKVILTILVFVIVILLVTKPGILFAWGREIQTAIKGGRR